MRDFRAKILAAAILFLAGNCLFLAPPAPAQLREADVTTNIEHAPASAPIRVAVRVSDASDANDASHANDTSHASDARTAAGQYVQVSITNTSDRDITLGWLTAEFPYARPEGENALIATGGWDMGVSETRIRPAATTDKLETGAFLATLPDDASAVSAAAAASAGDSTLAGFVTWKTFDSRLLWKARTLVIRADGEGRVVKPGETVSMEKVWLANRGNWQDLLFAYADRIAAENHIHLNHPKPCAGWATWDYFRRNWTSDDIEANMNTLLEICPQADMVQIDGGWWPERGDYMLARPDLGPDGMGMKRLAQLIRSKNLTAGIHLDVMRGDAKSAIAREHPDYFLRDAAGKMLVHSILNASDHLDYTYFDYSNPAARDYMKRVMANVRREWGFDYFKIDFLRYGLDTFIRDAVGKDTAIAPADRTLTSLERFHLALAAMREGMGADAWLLGCSAVFGPAFGHVDALRTGADIDPRFASFKRRANDNSGNFYLHGKVVYTDADYLVARAAPDQDASLVKLKNKDGANLALNEAQMWAHYVALCGGPRLASDKLPILRPERRALFQFAASFPTAERYIPLDFWAHARVAADPPAVILTTAKGDCYLGVFNWTGVAKTIDLDGLAAAQLSALTTVSGDVTVTAPPASTASTASPAPPASGALRLALKPRHSAILKIPGGDFDILRHAITVKSQ